MKALVLYDSAFGQTQQIAQSIASTLQEHGEVRLVPADHGNVDELSMVDLLVVGGPTQRHGLSPAMQTFLNSIPRGAVHGVPAAAFDTRFHMSRLLSGSAAQSIAKRLGKLGTVLLVPPESFFVAGKEGPLEEGEQLRAAQWAHAVLAKYELRN